MAEGGGLENRFTSNRDGGSNPPPSAKHYYPNGIAEVGGDIQIAQ